MTDNVKTVVVRTKIAEELECVIVDSILATLTDDNDKELSSYAVIGRNRYRLTLEEMRREVGALIYMILKATVDTDRLVQMHAVKCELAQIHVGGHENQQSEFVSVVVVENTSSKEGFIVVFFVEASLQQIEDANKHFENKISCTHAAEDAEVFAQELENSFNTSLLKKQAMYDAVIDEFCCLGLITDKIPPEFDVSKADSQEGN